MCLVCLERGSEERGEIQKPILDPFKSGENGHFRPKVAILATFPEKHVKFYRSSFVSVLCDGGPLQASRSGPYAPRDPALLSSLH